MKKVIAEFSFGCRGTLAVRDNGNTIISRIRPTRASTKVSPDAVADAIRELSQKYNDPDILVLFHPFDATVDMSPTHNNPVSMPLADGLADMAAGHLGGELLGVECTDTDGITVFVSRDKWNIPFVSIDFSLPADKSARLADVSKILAPWL